jgi:lycopene cyclase domain-containing protein
VTYALLNAFFLTAAVAIAAFKLRGKDWLVVVKVLLPMLALTAVFDNLIILSGIVDYQNANISGVKLWLAPIEDFGYTVFVSLVAPALWIRRSAK